MLYLVETKSFKKGLWIWAIVSSARDGSRALQALNAEQRADIINTLANSLIENQADILEANKKDLEIARNDGQYGIIPND